MFAKKSHLVWTTPVVALLALLAGCAENAAPPHPPLKLEPVTYGDLPGWQEDRISEALPALTHSCDVLTGKPPETKLGIAGKADNWRFFCSGLSRLVPGDDRAVRAYIEYALQPYAVEAPEGKDGLFTGYYEAQLRGSYSYGSPYLTPLYARPHDLITVDLADFSPDLKGHHIVGKVDAGKLKPYDDRAGIESRGFNGRADTILWVDDPVDAFFLAVQGSGRVTLPSGETVRVGFDEQNGRSYVAIGRVLAEAGEIPKPVSMQKIRAWLAAHPDRAQTVMDQNPSYVFFRILPGEGPIGAEGSVLTPQRSLAVDPHFIPLGIPLWLDTQDGRGTPLKRLMVAQDTGGAIKGAVRGDFFWGYGPDAEAEAGDMQSPGRYYLLLPRP